MAQPAREPPGPARPLQGPTLFSESAVLCPSYYKFVPFLIFHFSPSFRLGMIFHQPRLLREPSHGFFSPGRTPKSTSTCLNLTFRLVSLSSICRLLVFKLLRIIDFGAFEKLREAPRAAALCPGRPGRVLPGASGYTALS